MRMNHTTVPWHSRLATVTDRAQAYVRWPRFRRLLPAHLIRDVHSFLISQRRFWMLWDILWACIAVPVGFWGADVAFYRTDHASMLPIAGMFGVLFILTTLAIGLYERRVFFDHWRALLRAGSAAGLAGGLLVLVNWLVMYQPLGRTIVVLASGFAFMATALPRAALSVAGSEVVERLAVVGDSAARAIQSCTLQGGGNARIVLRFPQQAEPQRLAAQARRTGAQQVVVAPGCNGTTLDQMVGCIRRGVGVTGVVQYIEQRYERVPAELIDLSWVVDANIHATRPALRLLKRIGDVAISLIALTATLPLALALAIMIKATSRGPLFYVQTRVGQHGRHFRMIKFRTMCVDAEAPGQAVWAQKNDPRVTRLGQLMRKTRLDELPQLWNVLKGEMAFVGPRPERPAFERRLVAQVPHYRLRHLVKPGITGWAQVNYQYAACVDDALAKHHYDLYYIKYFTPLLDAMIVLRTTGAVLRGAR